MQDILSTRMVVKWDTTDGQYWFINWSTWALWWSVLIVLVVDQEFAKWSNANYFYPLPLPTTVYSPWSTHHWPNAATLFVGNPQQSRHPLTAISITSWWYPMHWWCPAMMPSLWGTLLTTNTGMGIGLSPGNSCYWGYCFYGMMIPLKP